LPEVETVSQAGFPETVQEVKSAGEGVTVMVDAPPAAGTLAVAGVRVTDPVAPDWDRVNVLSPMVTLAERAVTELLGAAVQETLFSAVVTVSQPGCPVTVQVL
jgi:hypothetical protein